MFVARLNQLEKAVACFSTAIKLDPFFVDGYIARGNVYMDYGHDRGLLTARSVTVELEVTDLAVRRPLSWP